MCGARAVEDDGLGGKLVAMVVVGQPHAVDLLLRESQDLRFVSEDRGPGISTQQQWHPVVRENAPDFVHLAATQRDEVGEVGIETTV